MNLQELSSMVTIVVMTCMVVLLAMGIDLAAGLYKAKLRGEFRSSWGLKRTINKFITYEGSMLIAAGVDLLIHMSNVLPLFGIESIRGVPFVTCMVGIFTLIVEFLSIREKADRKTKKEVENALELLTKVISSDKLTEILKTAIEQQNRLKDKQNDSETNG